MPTTSRLPADLAAAGIINAAGTLTRLSGARISPAVTAAMAEAAQGSFDMWRLQAAASQRIAKATGAEAGLVTSGASAGLTLAAAAVMAGLDRDRLARMPAPGECTEILMPRTHRNGYDRAVRLAGAVVVDIGTADRETGAGIRGLEAWEIETAIGPATCGMLASASPATEHDIAIMAGVARRHDLPLIVDASAQLPPVANLKRFNDLGADLVVFSGGKAIGGPQASGILAGRRDLIASASLQMLDMDVWPESFEAPAVFFPQGVPAQLPRHGIGRGFKASKEAVIGLLTALEEFMATDMAGRNGAFERRLAAIATALHGRNGVSCRVVAGRRPEAAMKLEIAIDPVALGYDAAAVCARLRAGRPPVHVEEGRVSDGLIGVDLIAVAEDSDAVLAAALREATGVSDQK